MASILLTIGWLAGAAGVLLAVFAGAARIGGLYWLGGFSTGTVLLGSMVVMMISCLGFLAALSTRRDAVDC